MKFLKRNWQITLLFVLIAMLAGFVVFRQYKMGGALPNVSGTPPAQDTLSAVFTIVWNGEARYMFTDAQGRNFELVVTDEILGKFGGPLSLDRKTVRVTGNISAGQDKIVVSALELKDNRSN